MPAYKEVVFLCAVICNPACRHLYDATFVWLAKSLHRHWVSQRGHIKTARNYKFCRVRRVAMLNPFLYCKHTTSTKTLLVLMLYLLGRIAIEAQENERFTSNSLPITIIKPKTAEMIFEFSLSSRNYFICIIYCLPWRVEGALQSTACRKISVVPLIK